MTKNNQTVSSPKKELTLNVTVKREQFTKKDTGEVIRYNSIVLDIDGEKFTLQPKQEDKRYLNRLLKEMGLYDEEVATANGVTEKDGVDLPF